MSNPVVHFEIGCKDASSTIEFYRQSFNWDIKPAGIAATIQTGADQGINGHITALGHEPHQYVHIYIQVENIQLSIEQIKANGGSLLIGPLPTPDGQQFAWFSDVAGNTLGLITKPQ